MNTLQSSSVWSRHYYGADIWSKPPSDLHFSFIYLGCQLTTAFCCQALLDGNSGWVQFAAEDKQVLTWRYFHETPFPNGFDEPVPRKQDRLYDTSISKRMDDPYWSVSPAPHSPCSVSSRVVDITPRLCIQHASPGWCMPCANAATLHSNAESVSKLHHTCFCGIP